jgi:hypothetical protein
MRRDKNGKNQLENEKENQKNAKTQRQRTHNPQFQSSRNPRSTNYQMMNPSPPFFSHITLQQGEEANGRFTENPKLQLAIHETQNSTGLVRQD